MTEDGEIIKLHEKTLEEVAMNIVNSNEDEKEKEIRIGQFLAKKSEFETTLKSKLGRFYFSFYNNLPKIDKQYLFRFIYLCTYLKYNDTRLALKLDNDRYTLIKENELQELLKLSKSEYYRTKDVLINNDLICIDKDDNIHINNKISTLGNTNNKNDFTRIFKDAIQNIYKKSLPREHKKLALFIDLLPYVNFNLNIICFNPNEVQPIAIDPLTIKDIQKILGDNGGKNLSRLRNTLLNTFIGDEKAMLIVKDFEKEFFVVNPKMYYKGNRIDDLNYLINLFSI